MFDNDNVMTDEVKLIIRWKIKGHLNESIEFNKSLIMSTHHYWDHPLAILDLLLSEVMLRDLAWDPISYVFVYSKSLRPTYFRALI